MQAPRMTMNSNARRARPRWAAALTVSLLFLVSCSSKTLNAAEDTKMLDAKTLVEKGMKAFFQDFSEEDVRALFTEDYIQHNPHVPTGLAPVIGLLPALKDANFGYTTHRILQDGDLVLTHTTYRNAEVFGANKVVAFDLWRVENGKIAEHWDAITPLVTKTASGRSQTDGATEVTDLHKTDENKELVRRFVTDVLIGENYSKMDDFIRDGKYDQHNPLVEDGPKALEGAIGFLKMKKIHRLVGEGNFVLTQSEGLWDGKAHVFYDLFRVADGWIVEHWDVLQEIPAEMAHDNGML